MSCRLKLRAQCRAVPPRQVDPSTQAPIVGTYPSFQDSARSGRASCQWGTQSARPSRYRWVAHMCRSGRSNRSKHGGRLPRLQSIENRSRQPVLWVPPTAPESAIKRTRSGAEQRARTTTAGRRRAAPNGTSGVTADGKQARRQAMRATPRTDGRGQALGPDQQDRRADPQEGISLQRMRRGAPK